MMKHRSFVSILCRFTSDVSLQHSQGMNVCCHLTEVYDFGLYHS